MIEQQRLNPDVFGQGLNQQVFGHTRTFPGKARKAMNQRNGMSFSPMARNNHTQNKPVYNDNNKHKRNLQQSLVSHKDIVSANSTTGVTAADRAARFGTTSKTAIYDNVSTFPNSFFPSLYM